MKRRLCNRLTATTICNETTMCEPRRGKPIRILPRKLSGLLLCVGSVALFTACENEPAIDQVASEPALVQATKIPHNAIITRQSRNDTLLTLANADLCQELDLRSDFAALRQQADFAGLALAYVGSITHELRLHAADQEFVARPIQTSASGNLVRLDQRYKGMRVWPAELAVKFDQAGHVVFVRGSYIPTPTGLNLTPSLDEEAALNRALDTLNYTAPCLGCKAELAIYVAEAGTATLAYDVLAATNQINARQLLVDARDGAILFDQPLALTSGAN